MGADSRVTARVISQLLTEIDGLLTLQNVLVIAATNRPDLIDPAVLRPGRFDRMVYVPAPDRESRLKILKIKTDTMSLDENVNPEEIIDRMTGYSGADIDSLVREAGMNALRRNPESDTVGLEDFDFALSEMMPSITPEMETWYMGVSKRFKEREKPPMAIA
jgi:transitional endoplasmic reticulum ATPase